MSSDGEEEVAAFITENVTKSDVEHAFVVIHGKNRDGDRYWRAFDDAIDQARRDDFPGSERQVVVVAPQFFSTVYNSGQYTDNQLAWGDLNAWQPGGMATHPVNTTMTSIDVLDALIEHYSDVTTYPSLKNVTVIGHGGGGQLTQRYAAVGREPPSTHVHVRYVHGDPSSCAYFTEDRPIYKDDDGNDGEEDDSKSSCGFFNTWRYGFDGFLGTGGVLKSPEEYFIQYAKRDVVSMVGYGDTKSKQGDRSCMARLQGGDRRRDRNLIWYRYVHTLAGTDEDLEGFPGEFVNMTDWSYLVGNETSLRLVVIKNATHKVEELFEGRTGQAVLFSDGDLETDWVPGSTEY